jgi:peptidoglycan-N-acetylglucosamine deacetylase
VNDITYPEAINRAKISNSTINYDDNTYNLHFSCTDEHIDDSTKETVKIKHEVWFTDAATSFNILRLSDEYATAGTALWRLGGEDSRIWTYYHTNLSNDAL